MTTAERASALDYPFSPREAERAPRDDVHAVTAQAAPVVEHTGLTNEKLESMLLRLHAQAPKAAVTAA